MKVNYTVWGGEHWGMQAIEHWYAYRQGWQAQASIVENMPKEFSANVEITEGDRREDAFNILFWSRPAEDDIIDVCKQYDMVLFCNGSENLGSGTPAMYDAVNKLSHCYIQSNSVLSEEHPMHDRVILSTDLANIWKWHFEPFYPTYFHSAFMSLTDRRVYDACWVNGTDRSWRHLFQSELRDKVEDVWIINTISDTVHETLDSFFETPEDTEFRISVNNQYERDGTMKRNMTGPYYEYSVPAGIRKHRGEIPPGNFLTEEYFTHNMVIFPETGWQNHELVFTEKMAKCMFSKTVPMPVGGAGIHRLYNDMGIMTGWNLLPDQMRGFDYETNHRLRYQMQVGAIKWLINNAHLSTRYNSKVRELVMNNADISLTYIPYTIGTQQFDKHLTRLYNDKYEC